MLLPAKKKQRKKKKRKTVRLGDNISKRDPFFSFISICGDQKWPVLSKKNLGKKRGMTSDVDSAVQGNTVNTDECGILILFFLGIT